MIERTNRKIEESLAQYVGEHHVSWSEFLSLVMMVYKWSVHTVTVQPNLYSFQKALYVTIDCMYQNPQSKVNPTPSDYAGSLKDGLQTCHQLVRETVDVEHEI